MKRKCSIEAKQPEYSIDFSNEIKVPTSPLLFLPTVSTSLCCQAAHLKKGPNSNAEEAR